MSKIDFDLFQLVILFGSVQGLIFAFTVLLVGRYRKNRSTIYLAVTVLLTSLTNIHHIIVVDFSYLPWVDLIRKTYIPWQWLICPFLFLYIHNVLGHDKLDTQRKTILFLPFVLIMTIHLTQFLYQYLIDSEFKISEYFEPGLFLYTNLASFIYAPLIMRYTDKRIEDYELANSKAIQKTKRETFWIKRLIKISKALIILGLASAVTIILLDMKNYFAAYPFLIATSISVYWTAYSGLSKATSMYRSLNTYTKINKKTSTHKNAQVNTFSEIDKYIRHKKIYLDSDLSLTTLSVQFDLSIGYLSQLINTHTEKSFNDYINELRIEASKICLTESRYNYYTIESIGLECGFKSKSNFYTAFKKFTNQTPNQYKNLVK